MTRQRWSWWFRGAVLAALVALAALLVFTVQSAKEAARRSTKYNNLKQIYINMSAIAPVQPISRLILQLEAILKPCHFISAATSTGSPRRLWLTWLTMLKSIRPGSA